MSYTSTGAAPATGAIGSTRSGLPAVFQSVVRSALKSTRATVSPPSRATHPGNLYSPGAASFLIASTREPSVSTLPPPNAGGEEELLAGVRERHPAAVQLDHVAQLAEAAGQLGLEGQTALAFGAFRLVHAPSPSIAAANSSRAGFIELLRQRNRCLRGEWGSR